MSAVGTGADLFDEVVGQEQAVGQLRAAVDRPVHAYLLVGPPGSGKRAAARAFAAAYLAGGALDGEAVERHRRLVALESHPDLVVVERTGPFITTEQARSIVGRSSMAGVEGDRRVFLLDEFHLVRDAAPMLLKAIEEPPAGTVFLVLADEVSPDLVTIASRCVRIDFHVVAVSLIVERLVAEGVDPTIAALAGEASGGDLDRARLLSGDPNLSTRVETWRGLPERLDGTGASVARSVDDVIARLDEAQGPVDERHGLEQAELAEREERYGERGSGRKALEERQRREKRRIRTDELRFGLGLLARAYRDRLADDARSGQALDALDALQAAAEAMERNPNERLFLESLLVKLGR